MCSGTEITTVVLQEFDQAMSKHGYICEIDSNKWQWESDLLDYYGCNSCMFTDDSVIHRHRLHCNYHKQMCEVRKVDGVIAGVSCKDWSRASPGRFIKKGVSVLQSATSAGGSAQTTHGLIAFVDAHSPIWCDPLPTGQHAARALF